MEFSKSRPLKSRQVELHQLFVAVDGTVTTPVAAGKDKAFVKSVTDNGTGDYTITFKAVAQQNIVPVAILPTTPNVHYNVVAVTKDSIRIAFTSRAAGTAVDASFNLSCLWHELNTDY